MPSASSLLWRHEALSGIREAVPLLVAASPFGMVFGAAAAAAGYSLAEIMLASATIFAGASQFVFIEIYGMGIPAWSVILTVFAVNFRHFLYSAAIGRRIGHFTTLQKAAGFFILTDLQYAACELRAGADGRRTVTAAFYLAFGFFLYVFWLISTALGAMFGRLIEHPERYGLDFILPVYFLAIVMGFRSRPGFLPIALSSGLVSYGGYLLAGPPWHIAAGATAGIAIAAILAPVEKNHHD